jgi:hypothetical protein
MTVIRATACAFLVPALAAGAVLLQPASSAAQDQVTVVTRSGDRVSGALEDLNNGTIYVRASLNDQRRLPLDGILVFDFAGNAQNLPEAELGDARGDDHLLVLRNGTRARGRLLNIEGGAGSGKPDEPRTISFRTASGEERRVRPSEVSRIYLGRYPAAKPAPLPAPAPTPQPQPPGPGLSVPANQRWTATGVFVRAGEMVRFNASGQVRLSGDANDTATPAGSASGRQAANAPLAGTLAGALIGRIGTGQPFGIGNQTQALRMPAAGQLFLGVNDDELGDNGGEFRVQVVPEGQRR